MQVIFELRRRVGEEQLHAWRVLVIHAGGYSKRLPHHAYTGKLFLPLLGADASKPSLADVATGQDSSPLQPEELHTWSMLEGRLATMCELPARMDAGLLMTAADLIEVFGSDRVELRGDSVIGFGHPAPVSLAHSHGVYAVLPTSETDPPLPGDQQMRPCARYLHKVGVEKLREEGAFYVGGDSDSDSVLVDSSVYFPWSFAALLSSAYGEITHDQQAPFPAEIDAYGDFMRVRCDLMCVCVCVCRVV
jgi:fucose-1-phosphate guanylyltransferase